MIPDKIAPQSNARAARQLLRGHRYGALSTLSKKFDGHPFGSITPYLVDHDGSLLILVSALAEHTKNMLHDPRVSLITHNQDDPHIQTQGRITVVGNAVADQDRDRCGKRYLRHFPEAQTYFDMPDFNFFRIAPLALRYIGGFGDIHWIKAENYQLARYPLIDEEDKLLDEINRNQRATLTAQYAQADGSEVTLIGVDCDGFDLRAGNKTWRGEFTELTLDAAQARNALFGREPEAS
jgi:putative heme iron utilization protein